MFSIALKLCSVSISSTLGFCSFFGFHTLQAQDVPPASSVSQESAPLTSPKSAPALAPNLTAAALPPPAPTVTTAATDATTKEPSSRAVAEMTAAMQRLKSEGKLTSNRAVSAALRKVISENSTQHEIAAPMGAKVIAVHKHPGDVVKVGDKIVTLELNGKQIPILAKQDGIMQTINVSKGGVIGNSRPRAAKYTPQQGSILLTLRNI